jgi:hypothetical protein
VTPVFVAIYTQHYQDFDYSESDLSEVISIAHMRIFKPPLPEGGGGYTVLPLSVCLSFLPSVQDIFRRIFLSNCWWQKSDIWSQASYRYTILWVAFLDPSDSYFLFADFFWSLYTLNIYAHFSSHFIPPLPEGGGGILFYLCPSVRPSFRPSKIFFVAFFSVTVEGRNLIFGHKHYIGTPYRGKRFWTHRIPTSCFPSLLMFIHI